MSAHVVTDMPEAEYHAHPALSHSGIKTLLRSPAHFRWERDHGREPTDNFDFGQAAHAKILGAGWETVVIDADDWRSKAAREARDEARTAGKTPLLRKDADVIDAMAAAVLTHPIAASLFEQGTAEQSLFSTDPATGIELRGRIDWITGRNERWIVVDYKTSTTADPDVFGKTAAAYHYHGAAAFYSDLVRDCGIDEDPAFLFVVQEKSAPHLVSVVELDHEAIATGRRENRYAIDLYARCVENDEWPGYDTTAIPLIQLPRWYRELGETT